MKWILLSLAIVLEVIGTTAMKYSEGFTKLLPSSLVIVTYILSFYFLSLTMKTIPMGLSYAIWSASGIVLIAAIGYYLFGQSLDLPAIIGLSLIVGGVLVINLFSESISH